jgi:DNA-binding IscR family transcriptional regulator
MQASAKVDYGLRAMLELASRSQADAGHLVSAEELAHAQGIPSKFLEGILTQLRRSGLVFR